MNHSISDYAKTIILDIWSLHGLETALEVSGRSRATLFRWKAALEKKEFKMPTTMAELEAVKNNGQLELVPDEIIENLLKGGR